MTADVSHQQTLGLATGRDREWNDRAQTMFQDVPGVACSRREGANGEETTSFGFE